MLASVSVRRALVIAAGLALALASAEASAQSRRPRRTPTQPAQPAQQTPPGTPAAAQPDEPPLEPSPYIKRVKPRRWTLTTDVFIGATQWLEPQDGVQVPKHDTFEFETATVVFPVLPETASSVLEVWGPADQEVPAVSGRVELGDRVLADEVTILSQGIGGGPLPCGTWRAQWQVQPAEEGRHTVRELELYVSVAQVCYETVFDDPGASQLDWPTGPWPPEAAACFQPQTFVDFNTRGEGYDVSPIAALVQQWTEGQDPRNVKPVVLAKYLAGKVVEHVQVSGEGLVFDVTGLLKGFETPGAAEVAATGRGTEVDLPCLLVAVYRAVGIPARLVIGYDKEGEGDQVYLKKTKGAGEFRIWVEFCVYDEANHTMGWVPVDIVQMRRQQNRMPRDYHNRPLKYFGTHDRLDDIAPIAFHFHPPTTVRSYGAPAFWGWFVTPTPPGRATQRVRLNMNTSPSGGQNESHLPARLQDK